MADKSAYRALADKIRNRTVVVGVVGLGYVGLPLAAAFARAGCRVIGFDTDPKKASALNAGKSYIRHIPAADVRAVLNAHGCATNTPADLAAADAILICVPTPLTPNREPDMQYIRGTADMLARVVRPGQLIVLESTTYPGTTRTILQPALEAGGLRAGKDFFLAYSPEREDPGSKNHSAACLPKVTGGLTKNCLALARALYEIIVPQTVPVSSLDTAEAAKLLENIFRCVNIALVNELKVVFDRMGIDVWEVINAAATKPFGFMPFYPGPGLGGHCIPIDPFYLTWKAREVDCATRFIELAGEVNASMPEYVVGRTALALNDARKSLRDSKILIIGAAYKKDVDDIRESPSLRLMELLLAHGAVVAYHDPFVPALPRTRKYNFGLRSQPLTPAVVRAQDAVLIATDHTDVEYALLGQHAKIIIDTRNAMARVTRPKARVVKA